MKKFLSTTTSGIVAFSAYAVSASSALAQGYTPPPTLGTAATIGVAKPVGALPDIGVVISGAITLIFIAAGLVGFIQLLLGGIKWITSGGDSGKVEEARNQIIQALIGIVVVLAVWGLLIVVQSATGACFGLGCTIQIPKLY
jgi:hypothetical protein